MRALVAAVALAIMAAAVVRVSGVLDGAEDPHRPGDVGPMTWLAPVERRSLSEQTQVSGTLGYAGSYTVLGQAQGTVTWLPAEGAVIGQGQPLYLVDGAPVVLLYGPTPAYRALARATHGTDVAQLNHDLVALGYVRAAAVDPAWDRFTWATKAGVKELQQHLGVAPTGTLSPGDVVFLPTAARVTSLDATLGGPAGGRVMAATSTTRTVSVTLDAGLQSQVREGDRVTITLPDARTTAGRVASVGKVATGPSGNAGPTVPVHITPLDPRATGGLDQAPVEVAITGRTVHDVLAVKVTALVALAGGRYAVEVAAPDGTHHLVPVTPGLFDDAAGMVQVSGPALAAGQRVVVPGP